MTQLRKDLTNIINEFKSLFALILSICISLGIIAAQKTDSPIKFKASDEVKLSFVAVSDTHIKDDSFKANDFSRLFDDLKNTDEKFDALVIPGDLTELGLDSEYNAFFGCLEEQDVFAKNRILLTMGNHDARLAYDKNSKIIMNKVNEYLGIDTEGKSYYSYDVNGYTFIMLCTEKRVFEKAYISDAQLAFLDSELARATKDGKPAFVVCHQPLQNTHGLPEVWKTGDIGDQSAQIKDILTKYTNVFFINGHLHDGLGSKTVETLSENVYSINLPTYGKTNDLSDYSDSGCGVFFEVYDGEVVFTGRNFKNGTPTDFVYCLDISK